MAISRVHLATDCSVYVNDGYCAERNGRPCAVLGSVVYDELLNPPSEAPPATPAPVDHPSRRQSRLADLSGQLDDASTDRRVRHRMFLSNATPRANQAHANHLPARKRKRYEALFPELFSLLYVTAVDDLRSVDHIVGLDWIVELQNITFGFLVGKARN